MIRNNFSNFTFNVIVAFHHNIHFLSSDQHRFRNFASVHKSDSLKRQKRETLHVLTSQKELSKQKKEFNI